MMNSYTGLIALLCLISQISFSQIQPPPPDLGVTDSFAIFTAVGALTNDGTTLVTGDIGSNVGGVSGFPPGVLVGSIHDADAVSAVAATDVCNAYAYLAGIVGGATIGTTLGSGQTLTPNVYILGAASSLNGELILDAENDPDAIFIFQIDGALATTPGSTVTLINGALSCNVFWQVNGATTIGEGSSFQGNILGNGAIHVLEASTLNGRGLTCAGAIDLHNNVISIGLPTASAISADGPTTFCEGQSVTLSGNVNGVWNTGETTPSILVTVSGDYFITNTNGCVGVNSDTITVIVNLSPACTITGDLTFCQGQSTELCAPTGATSYAWSNGSATNCTIVTAGGVYSVTVTDANGCTSVCSATVTEDTLPVCTITGDLTFCRGQSTELCAPTGATSYAWSNGSATNCTTVTTAGVYSVTVTDSNGCSSVCSATVTEDTLPVCTITGDLTFCQGQSTELCVSAGAASYAWSTGSITNCTTVSAAGTVSVTITDANGCTNICSAIVTEDALPDCIISGDLTFCQGQSTELCVSAGAASYVWSTGSMTNCTTVTTSGTVSVTITDANGCTNICSAMVTEDTLPACSITGNLSICGGQSTELCVAAGFASYAWSTGSMTNCTTVSSAGTVSVTITDANGCANICSVMVTEDTLPACSITGNLSVCGGQSTELCVDGVFATYEWSSGAMTSCITVTTAGLYSVTATDINGCTSVCSATVLEDILPACSIIGNLAICGGQSTVLCVPAGSASYEWNTGVLSNCITVNTAGVYSVTVTDTNGCTSVCSATVIEDDLPACSITGDLTICGGQSTELCVPAGSASYEWNTGSLSNCITVNTAGVYSVTVTDSNDCTSICSATVLEDILPTCTITGNLSICGGQSTELCADGVFASYEWSNGSISDCITVATAGLYSVTVTDINGCTSVCSALVFDDVLPACSITGNLAVCGGQSTELCVPAGAASYSWNTGAISNCITVGTAGLYSVTVTDINGCTSVCSATVLEDILPACTISGESFLCDGIATEICVPVGAASYLWSSGETTPCITVSDPGFYEVTVTSLDGCLSICSIQITGSSLPACTITGEDIGCDESSTEICTTPGAESYLWNTGDTTNCIQVSLVGLYFVTVTDENGCSSVCSHTVAVDVDSPPTITCPTDVTIECDELTIPAHTGLIIAPIYCNEVPVITFIDEVTQLTCTESFIISRIWTVTYASGYTSSCTQIITVEDNTPPAIICPPNITIECDESVQPLNTGLATATDNCSVPVAVTFSDVITTDNCIQGSTITRTWQATDNCGNSSTCLQVITLEDNTPPVITIVNPLLDGQGDTTFVQCYGQDPLWSIPLFDEESVEVTDNCGSDITVDFTQTLISEGDCEEDGYLLLYRLTWTATDICENSSTAIVYYAMIDTIGPVIHGVPDDITVQCNDIPLLTEEIYAEDECLCACLIFVEESTWPEGCMDGEVILRTWTATDDCGNETSVTQRITIIDDQGPAFIITQPELAGVEDGDILEFLCSEGGIPTYFDLLGEHSIEVLEGNCSGSASFTFSTTVVNDINCDYYGYKEEHIFHWTATDECGHTNSITIYGRLIDDEAPVFIGIPDSITCWNDPVLEKVYAIDDCEGGVNQYTFTKFWDNEVPNPCGAGTAFQRIYEAYDNCGNSVRDSVMIIKDDSITPVITFVDETMNQMSLGEIMIISCDGSEGRYTSYGSNDVMITDACSEGVTVTFAENLISTEDCISGDLVSVVELLWTVTDVCGNASERSIIAHIEDNTGPEFLNFQPAVTIDCIDPMPQVSARDNCGEVILTYRDSTIQGECEFEYIIYREITATDPCGNSTVVNQVIQVGDGSGPVIVGVEENVCDDLTIPEVTAFDNCAGDYVEVTMVQDTLDIECGDGFVIQRTWSAVNVCGNETVIIQNIIMHHETLPLILPNAAIIQYILDMDERIIYMSDREHLDLLNELNHQSVIVSGACGLNIIPELTIYSHDGDCVEDGYSERRMYVWVATDVCGNSSSISLSVDIVDDVPPQMLDIPADTTMVCVDLPDSPNMLLDSLDDAVVEFTEVITPGSNPNEYIVTRTWIATDTCGNVTIREQRITWIPNTDLFCEINLPSEVSCNTHGVLITSTITGGGGEYTYDWEIEGDKCFIQGGQGTPQLNIYVGWGEVKITLTVTDAYGCVSVCMISLHCDHFKNAFNGSSINNEGLEHKQNLDINLNDEVYLSDVNIFPNPTTGHVTLRFESEISQEVILTSTDLYGRIVLYDRLSVQKGMNSHLMQLDNLTAGTYMIQMKTDNEVHTRMIVVIPGN